MHLYISSFNSKLFKSILITLVIVIIYAGLIEMYEPKVTTFQNQWVENYSVAEKYLYNKEPFRVVIVGSSMSARLPDESLPSDIYNLSFRGGSVLTGLNIIIQSKRLPKTLFIETNIIERQIDNKMIDYLFIPIVWQMKEKILSLQYTYQPINLLLTYMKNKLVKNEVQNTQRPVNKKIFIKSLKRHIEKAKQTQHLVNTKNLIKLKKLINYFTKQGVKIAFFQMPVEKSILLSEQYKIRKKILTSMFPNNKFYWANIDHVDNFQTTDGLHLTPYSAGEYSSELSKYFEK